MLLKKLIKNLSPEQNKIKIRGLSIDSKKIHNTTDINSIEVDEVLSLI